MDGATETRPAGTAFQPFWPDYRRACVGVLAMLAWLGVSAAWQQRSFWTSENLMASIFYGRDAPSTRASPGGTVSGLAVYLLVYSLLGGLLAWVVRDRLVRIRVLLVSVAFALAWYYLSYRVLWRSVAPLVSLLHVERATVLGHLVYGTFLGRYPVYLPKAAPAAAEEAPVAEGTAESAAEAGPPRTPPAEAAHEPAVDSEGV